MRLVAQLADKVLDLVLPGPWPGASASSEEGRNTEEVSGHPPNCSRKLVTRLRNVDSLPERDLLEGVRLPGLVLDPKQVAQARAQARRPGTVIGNDLFLLFLGNCISDTLVLDDYISISFM